MTTQNWLYSFDTACRELGIYAIRESFHEFVGAGQVQPLTWWREQHALYRVAIQQAEDAKDERETMADALC